MIAAALGLIVASRIGAIVSSLRFLIFFKMDPSAPLAMPSTLTLRRFASGDPVRASAADNDLVNLDYLSLGAERINGIV